MKPYGSKRSFDTEPRIKSARALVKREGEDLAAEQIEGDVSPRELEADPATCRKECCMPKVWEEEWGWGCYGELTVSTPDARFPTGKVYVPWARLENAGLNGKPGDVYEQRLDLASAAPDMARALLAIEWEGRAGPAGDVRGACPSCEAELPDSHRPDCALDGALRRAGVR